MTSLPPSTLFVLDGRALLRFGIALILLWFGYMKFLPYEAEGVAGIARDYWLFGWLYPVVGVAGSSIVIGVLEITAGLLIAIGGRWPVAGLLGALMGVATFVVTLSFFLTAPGIVAEGYAFPALGSTGQFLAKDVGLLAICVFLAFDARDRLRRA
jgi:reactive chlorine resistance protein C